MVKNKIPPSPAGLGKESKKFKVGHVEFGADKKKWYVLQDKNGRKRWMKVTPTTKTETKRGRSPSVKKKSTTAKKPKKSVSPKKKIPDSDQINTVLGLAIGDSMGATSEFENPKDVYKLTNIPKNKGWPLKLVGNGHFNWRPGQPTDDTDMAMCILRAWKSGKKKMLDGKKVLGEFAKWLDGKPPDVGITTGKAIKTALKKKNWYGGAKELYETSNKPNSGAANGSLMRNGVIGALYYDDIDDALTATIIHGIVTHWSPLCVISCAIQTFYICTSLTTEYSKLSAPTMTEIKTFVEKTWKPFLKSCTHKDVVAWRDSFTKKQLDDATKKVYTDLSGFETFNPYTHNYDGKAGYVVLSLKIALWALYWSYEFEYRPFSLRDINGLSAIVFKNPGDRPFNVIMWVALIGEDSDTWCAISGSILSARFSRKHSFDEPHFLEPWRSQLEVYDEVVKLMS